MDGPTKRILLIGGVALSSVLLVSVVLYQLYSGRLGSRPELPVLGRLPAFSWTAADGTEVDSETLKGKVWFGYFFFSTCPGVCIPMAEAVQGMHDAVQDIPGARVVGVTCDPDVDTLEVLAKYGKGYGFDPKTVHLVRDDYESVQHFAQTTLQLGMERRSEEAIEQGAEKVYHSSRFFLIDQELRLRGYYSGLELEATQRLLRDMRRLAQAGREES